ncbi:MAG: phospholipase phosphocholine-specific, partial [Myxococcaceae bacterium]|nr:phospholipase phosphocholine-specific [Myxococcaceae bacterium]
DLSHSKVAGLGALPVPGFGAFPALGDALRNLPLPSFSFSPHDRESGWGTGWQVTVHPYGHALLAWPVQSNGGWYDFLVTCGADDLFARRFAGRIETGRHSVSDPGMGLADDF